MRVIILVNIAVWSLLLLIFTTVRLPGNSLFTEALQNAGHGLAMCAAAFIGIWSMKRKDKALSWIPFVFISIALLLLSVLIEVVQHFNGRDANLADLVLDTAGIAAGICLSLVVFVKSRLFVKAIFLVVGLSLLLFVMRMPIYYMVEKLLAPPLPILANFDNVAAAARIESGRTVFSIGDHQEIWPVSTDNSLKVTFLPRGQWPRVKILELPKDWSSYAYLSMDVFNDQDTDVNLNIRVDYKPSSRYRRAHMVARRTLPPGYSTIDVSYEELAQEVYGDKPDFTQIREINLFMYRLDRDITLYFDNVLLR